MNQTPILRKQTPINFFDVKSLSKLFCLSHKGIPIFSFCTRRNLFRNSDIFLGYYKPSHSCSNGSSHLIAQILISEKDHKFCLKRQKTPIINEGSNL